MNYEECLNLTTEDIIKMSEQEKIKAIAILQGALRGAQDVIEIFCGIRIHNYPKPQPNKNGCINVAFPKRIN